MEPRHPVIYLLVKLEHRVDVHKAPKAYYLRFLCSEAQFLSTAQPRLSDVISTASILIELRFHTNHANWEITNPIVWPGGHPSQTQCIVTTGWVWHSIISPTCVNVSALCGLTYQLPDYSVTPTVGRRRCQHTVKCWHVARTALFICEQGEKNIYSNISLAPYTAKVDLLQ